MAKYICKCNNTGEVLCIFPEARHNLMRFKEGAIPEGVEPIRFDIKEHAEKACVDFNSYHGGNFKPETI